MNVFWDGAVRLIVFLFIPLLLLSGCVAPQERVTSTDPRYRSDRLADEWRNYGSPQYGTPPSYPIDNDAEYYRHPYGQGYPPPLFYPPGGGYASPYGRAPYAYPRYNPDADNSVQPYPPPVRQQPPSLPRDNDADYYYPLFFDE